MFENNMKETNPLEIHDVIVAGGVAVPIKEDELILIVEGHVLQVLLHIAAYESLQVIQNQILMQIIATQILILMQIIQNKIQNKIQIIHVFQVLLQIGAYES